VVLIKEGYRCYFEQDGEVATLETGIWYFVNEEGFEKNGNMKGEQNVHDDQVRVSLATL